DHNLGVQSHLAVSVLLLVELGAQAAHDAHAAALHQVLGSVHRLLPPEHDPHVVRALPLTVARDRDQALADQLTVAEILDLYRSAQVSTQHHLVHVSPPPLVQLNSSPSLPPEERGLCRSQPLIPVKDKRLSPSPAATLDSAAASF